MENRLAELRRERGWSQQRLADELGVSRRTIISIEGRRFDPSLPLAFRIARLFGRPIEELFRDDEAGPVTTDR
ncbi:helix-turn-helix transcriptional regulator [Microbacterium lacticum]